MSKKVIVLLSAFIFLIASIFYSYSAKKSYFENKEQITKEIKDIKETIALKKIWKAKGLKKKIEKVLQRVPNKRVIYKKKSLELSANNLSYQKLNYILNKFASMPLQFEKLNIKRVGDNFNLECLCVW